jgi:hypothetical protein
MNTLKSFKLRKILLVGFNKKTFTQSRNLKFAVLLAGSGVYDGR